MKTGKCLLPAVAFASLAIVPLLQSISPAGRYSSTPAYRAPTSSPVYGFRPNGQSFTYQPSGSSPLSGSSRGAAGITSYGPQYRFDSFTAPRTRAASPSPTYSQSYYFSGRMWYPRNP